MHMPHAVANGAIDRVAVGCELFTPDTLLALGGEIAPSPNFDEHKLPPTIEDVFDTWRYIDNLACGDDFVVSMHVSVV